MTSAKHPPVDVAVGILMQENGDVLLAQRPAGKPYAGYWEFPGGKLEPNETPQAALRRAIREELGMEIRVSALLADALHGEIHLSLYAAEIEHGAPVLLEHSAIAWIRDDEINKYALCPADRELLRRLGKLL